MITSCVELGSPAIVACTVSSSPGSVSALITERSDSFSPRARRATSSCPWRGDTAQPKPCALTAMLDEGITSTPRSGYSVL